MKRYGKYLMITLLLMAALALVAEVKTRYIVNPETCIGCQICVGACPVQAITMVEGKAIIDQDKCISCGICFNKCPIKAIEMETVELETEAVEEAEAAVEAEIQEEVLEQQLPKPYVVDSAKCIGCQLCVGKCPVQAITMVRGKAVIDADKCIGCGICDQTCPVDAIEQTE